MPIPKVAPGEMKKAFIARCMGNRGMLREYPDQKKRAGVCYTQWNVHAKKEQDEFDELVENTKGRLKINSFKQLKMLLEASVGSKKKETNGDKVMKETTKKGTYISEAFLSLQTELTKAVKMQIQGNVYVVDFSPKWVVFNKYGEGVDQYFKMKYKVKRGKAELQGSPILVDRKVVYENQISSLDFVELIELNKSVEE